MEKIVNSESVGSEMLPTNPIGNLLHLVRMLANSETRDFALIKLNELRFNFPNFAKLVWNNDFIISCIMDEIKTIYTYMTMGMLSVDQAHRLSRMLSLVHSFVDHPEIRRELLNTHILIHIFPFLKTMYQSYQYEFLRITSLSVLLTLAESCDPSAISFLIVSGFMPIALVYMEYGSVLCKTNSIHIFRIMIQDEKFLKRICETEYLLRNVIEVLHKMVLYLSLNPHPVILRHVIKTYLRIADDKDARMALSICLPEELRNQTFANCFKQDIIIERCLQKLTLLLWFQSDDE